MASTEMKIDGGELGRRVMADTTFHVTVDGRELNRAMFGRCNWRLHLFTALAAVATGILRFACRFVLRCQYHVDMAIAQDDPPEVP